MLQNILLVILIVDAAALTGVILLQRSEGGALGMGGGGGAFLSVRGAGDLLTRTTWILAGIALVLSITITLLMNHDRSKGSVAERLNPNNLNIPVAPLQQQPQQGPASSAAPVAPPLPGAAPPLPGTGPAPAATNVLPTQAPAPVARAPQRRAPSPATRPSTAERTVPADPLANITAPPARSSAPAPRIDLTAPAPSSTPQQ